MKKEIRELLFDIRKRVGLRSRLKLLRAEVSLEAKMKELKYGLNTNSDRNMDIIVSLTSISARLNKLHYVIYSLFLQTMKPDKIVLNIGDDVSMEELPEQLVSCEKYGLQIKKRAGDLKPHKKYYYVMKEYPNALVITVDDDVVYPENLIKELYKCHQIFPECVIAARAHKMTFDEYGVLNNYGEWEPVSDDTYVPCMKLFPTGVGGVLYPPQCMSDEVFNTELFQRLAPLADDIWLKVMQVLNRTSVVVCDQTLWRHTVKIVDAQKIRLTDLNVAKGMNDVYLNNLMRHYNLTPSDFNNFIS